MSINEHKLQQIRVEIERRTDELAPADLACARGCSYCCHYPISIHSLAEAGVALHAAQASRGRKAFSDLKREIRRQFQQTRMIDSIAAFCQLKLPCPFLVDDSCSIYDSRPISCRTCISDDRIVCMSALAPGGYALQAGESMRGYWQEINRFKEHLYKDSGYGDCMLELRAALVYVLDHGAEPPQPMPIDPLHAQLPRTNPDRS